VRVEAFLSSLAERRIRLIPDGDGLVVEPASRLTDADRQIIRQHKPELLARVRQQQEDAEIDRLAQADGRRHELSSDSRLESPPAATAMLPPLLTAVADAIASAPRSPFLDDLAIGRAARSYVEVERAINDAPHAVRIEAARIATDAMNLVAGAIRQARYQTAYELLDSLTTRMREMRMH
jgi:hypothetical protein